MDSTWTNTATQLGLGGTMALAVVWFLRHLVTVTLPEIVRTFACQLEAERTAGERHHNDLVGRLDRLEDAQQERHAENRADAKEVRHQVKSLEGSVILFAYKAGVVKDAGGKIKEAPA